MHSATTTSTRYLASSGCYVVKQMCRRKYSLPPFTRNNKSNQNHEKLDRGAAARPGPNSGRDLLPGGVRSVVRVFSWLSTGGVVSLRQASERSRPRGARSMSVYAAVGVAGLLSAVQSRPGPWLPLWNVIQPARVITSFLRIGQD